MSLDYTHSDTNKNLQSKTRKIFDILIVDDDENIAKYLKEILTFRGHNVRILEDGLRCITVCKENNFDIVFMDYHMDGLDGAQVADILKNDSKKTIIFAYTGDNSQKAIDEFKNVGMNGIIVKPFDISCIDILMNKFENSEKLDTNTIKMISRKSLKSIIIFDEVLIQ